MKARMMFASLLTLGVLFGFVGTIVLLALYFGDFISAPALIAATVLLNIIFWLVAPFVQDLLLRWIYRCEIVEWPQFQQRWPALAESIRMVCEKHKIPIPKMRLIDDGNPTAYTFGSGPWNARIVVTRGLFDYLDTDEATAVYFHELGHIVNRDFMIMTLAATLLTLLYELYAIFAKGRGDSDSRSRLAWLGYVSYIFYLIASYMVLYLSRTREYLADRFAAEECHNPNWLANGLVKVAYGIATAPDTPKSKRLLASTRALGLYDYKAADATGSSYARIATPAGAGGAAVAVAAAPKTGAAAAPAVAPERVERVFLYDLFNPWAKVAEFNSTHPLTGKRIRKLMEYCQEFNVAPKFDFTLANYEGQFIDRGRMRRTFAMEVGIYFAPALGFLIGLLAAAMARTTPGIIAPILGVGLGLCLRGLYRFPGGTAERTSVFELMCDPYASPVRGRLVALDGKLVGRASAGNPIGEDMVMQDRTGLITLNYESWLPLFGNLLFGWRSVKRLMEQQVTALGWFRRSTSAIVDLTELSSSGAKVQSYTRFWGVYMGPFVVFFAVAVMALLWGA